MTRSHTTQVRRGEAALRVIQASLVQLVGRGTAGEGYGEPRELTHQTRRAIYTAGGGLVMPADLHRGQVATDIRFPPKRVQP